MAKSKHYAGDIPFDKDDNALHYPDSYYTKSWRANHEFPATLTFKEFARGRSAAYAVFQCGQVRKYTMFLTDLEQLLRSNILDQGVVSGIWTYTKRGQNFGIKKVN